MLAGKIALPLGAASVKDEGHEIMFAGYLLVSFVRDILEG